MAHYHTLVSTLTNKLYWGAVLELHEDQIVKAKILNKSYLPKKIQQTKIVKNIYQGKCSSYSKYITTLLVVEQIVFLSVPGDTITGAVTKSDYRKYYDLHRQEYLRLNIHIKARPDDLNFER